MEWVFLRSNRQIFCHQLEHFLSENPLLGFLRLEFRLLESLLSKPPPLKLLLLAFFGHVAKTPWLRMRKNF
jgi:hypothetical protein